MFVFYEKLLFYLHAMNNETVMHVYEIFDIKGVTTLSLDSLDVLPDVAFCEICC